MLLVLWDAILWAIRVFSRCAYQSDTDSTAECVWSIVHVWLMSSNRHEIGCVKGRCIRFLLKRPRFWPVGFYCVLNLIPQFQVSSQAHLKLAVSHPEARALVRAGRKRRTRAVFEVSLKTPNSENWCMEQRLPSLCPFFGVVYSPFQWPFQRLGLLQIDCVCWRGVTLSLHYPEGFASLFSVFLTQSTLFFCNFPAQGWKLLCSVSQPQLR